jgi:hypothetical protein
MDMKNRLTPVYFVLVLFLLPNFGLSFGLKI